jgi:hypothetical protein
MHITTCRLQDFGIYSPDVFYSPGPYRAFRPVLDGEIIKDYPTRLLSQGRFAQVPLIVGSVPILSHAYVHLTSRKDRRRTKVLLTERI